MKLTKEERSLVLRALWFMENESLGEDDLLALIARFQSKEEKELKIYSHDMGWKGNVTVVAESSDAAKLLIINSGHPSISEDYFDNDSSDLEGIEINAGVISVGLCDI